MRRRLADAVIGSTSTKRMRGAGWTGGLRSRHRRLLRPANRRSMAPRATAGGGRL